MKEPITSALFIDFENMPLDKSPMKGWLRWLEDGIFDQGRPRVFALKRVYWNSSAKKHEAAYLASGFDVVLCDRFHGLVNSVDMQMAVDIVEAIHRAPAIEEFLLFTRDSDFVPVLRRLREKGKRTGFLVDEHQTNLYTTYRLHADVLISVRELKAAAQYARDKAAAEPAIAVDTPKAPAVEAAKPSKPKRKRKAAAAPTPPTLPDADTTRRALELVVSLASGDPGNNVARTKVNKILKRVAGFTVAGDTAYLGFGTYNALMKELSRLDPRLAITKQGGGGIGVAFVRAGCERKPRPQDQQPPIV